MEILIHEVGMRDGLQMEKRVVPLEKKMEWAELLCGSGVASLQLGSFVHPGRVPQMADSERLFHHFSDDEEIVLSGLVLNEKGLERALSCRVDVICMGVSASDTHSRRNVGIGTEEALEQTIAMARTALDAGRQVQVSVQSAFGCGYEGEVPIERVLGIVGRYGEEGLSQISLADTSGHADPRSVGALFEAVHHLDAAITSTCHFHDTFAMGLVNCLAAFEAGVRNFESSFGGLGGCPFTARAGGNVCTEDLIHMFQRMGYCSQLRLEPLLETAREASAFFGRALPGKLYKIGPISSALREPVQ